MSEQLEELREPQDPEGRETYVNNTQHGPKIEAGDVIFEIFLWLLAIIPGLIFAIVKIKAKSYLRQLQEDCEKAKSSIDIAMEKKDATLVDIVELLPHSIKLDKELLSAFKSARGVSEKMAAATNLEKYINVALENYPDLKAHGAIRDAMQTSRYLTAEMEAARELYNDKVGQWNRDIFAWPAKKMAAAKMKLVTKTKFTVSLDVRNRATGRSGSYFKDMKV